MKSIFHHIFSKRFLVYAGIISLTLTGCEKYLNDTPLPADKTNGNDVYVNDNMAGTVVSGVYISMNTAGGFAGSANGNLGYNLGLYADETKSTLAGNFADIVYKNAITTGNSTYWADAYKKLFTINAAINGINNSTGKLVFKDQWLGECYFLRAFYHFYLVNIYGPVPIVTTNDYRINNGLSRAPEADVYKQIIADLKMAQSLLSAEYKNGFGATTANRLRPNKAAATALLSRAYLYAGDWENAELQATAVIENTTYDTIPLNNVFLANSRETIWALAPNTAKPVYEYVLYNNGLPATFNPPQGPSSFRIYSVLSMSLVNAFENDDQRLAKWVRKITVNASGTNPAIDFYCPAKYKSSANNEEYQVMLRLGEQYLIRAEARARQDKGNAADDLNLIRKRAGLPDIHPAGNTALLNAIVHEKRVELFTEYGHRFFDLKRTGTIDAVMTAEAVIKASKWESYMAYWPLPPNDLLANTNLTPNPGYDQ